MMPTISAIGPIGTATLATAGLSAPVGRAPTPAATGDFGAILAAGLQDVGAKVARADALVEAFAAGRSIPVHQVTLALEEARLSVDLAMEVRARLVEAYRDFMSMQV